MLYLVKVRSYDDVYANYLFSAQTEKELKIKIEDMLGCISANKIEGDHWEIQGFDTLEANGSIKFQENLKDDIYVSEVDSSYIENLCVNGMELIDPFEV